MDYATARRKMVESQIRPDDVTDEAVINAFSTVPREAFLPKSKQPLAYSEMEVPTVEGRAFWCARDLAKLLQAMELDSGDLVLVVGAGEGYSAALLNNIVDTVIALEATEEMTEATTDRLAGLGADRVACVTGDLQLGYAAEGPYDAILINGRVEQVPPALLEQLKPGGRLGTVIGTDFNARAVVYTASEHSVASRSIFECVPPKLSEFDVEPAFQF